MKLVSGLAVAMLAACAALADETRISIGYGTIDQGIRLPGIPDPILKYTFGEAETAGQGYQVLVEGDQDDFLYSLSYGRSSVAGKIPTSLSVGPAPPQSIDASEFESAVETVSGSVGWHGLNLGEFGFGPVIKYSRNALSNTKLVIGGQAPLRNSDTIFAMASERTVLGALMRRESDLFDFSASAGSIISGDDWKHGLTLSIDADVHVSDAVTLTGDWTRTWGEHEGGGDASADMFGLGGRVHVRNGFFLEGNVVRRKNGTNSVFGDDLWGTSMRLGIGRAF